MNTIRFVLAALILLMTASCTEQRPAPAKVEAKTTPVSLPQPAGVSDPDSAKDVPSPIPAAPPAPPAIRSAIAKRGGTREATRDRVEDERGVQRAKELLSLAPDEHVQSTARELKKRGIYVPDNQ
jgi:hypothetical protein